MITSKDNCEQFRRDLKSYNYYKAKLEDINDQLLELSVSLQGVSSPGVKDVIIENKDPYQSNKIELIMQEEILSLQKKNFEFMIAQIESKLQALPKRIRKVCIELYIKGKNSESVAFENGYEYTAVMYRDINKHIEKLG